MTDLDPAIAATLQVVISFLAPLIGAIPGQMDGKMRGRIAGLAAVAIVLGIDIAGGNFSIETAGGKAMAAFAFAHMSYAAYWSSRGINSGVGKTPVPLSSDDNEDEVLTTGGDDPLSNLPTMGELVETLKQRGVI